MTREMKACVREGDTVVLDQLIRAGAEVDAKDEYGQTALMLAAGHGQTEIVRCLLTHHPDLDHTAKYHLSALMLAVLNGHAEIVRALVGAGADQAIRGRGAPGFQDKTALDLARLQNRADLIGALRGPD